MPRQGVKTVSSSLDALPQVIQLSDDFVKLLGVDRASAEALQSVFAARCEQLLPVRNEGNALFTNTNSSGAMTRKNVHATSQVGPLETRLAPRAVLLTRNGSLLILKRENKTGAITERLEFGAYLPRYKSKKRKNTMMDENRQKGNTETDEDTTRRIEITVDEKPLSNGMQTLCITGLVRSKERHTPRQHVLVQELEPRHPTTGTPPAASSASPYSKSLKANESSLFDVQVVVALQFYSNHGLLASALAVKIKQIATFYGHAAMLHCALNPHSTSLQLARQHMARCTVPPESLVWPRSMPRHRAKGNWRRALLPAPRATVRDMVVKGLDEPAILASLARDMALTRELGSDGFDGSSSSSSMVSSKCTTDTEAEREEEMEREAQRAAYWRVSGREEDVDNFDSRLVELLDDIAHLEEMLREQRVSQPTEKAAELHPLL